MTAAALRLARELLPGWHESRGGGGTFFFRPGCSREAYVHPEFDETTVRSRCEAALAAFYKEQSDEDYRARCEAKLARDEITYADAPTPTVSGDATVTLGGLEIPIIYGGINCKNVWIPSELAPLKSTCDDCHAPAKLKRWYREAEPLDLCCYCHHRLTVSAGFAAGEDKPVALDARIAAAQPQRAAWDWSCESGVDWEEL